MGKSDKAVELVDKVFDEGFENYSRIKAAEKHVDYLLDMSCGPLKKKKKLKENMGSLSFSMTGRPYDHPRKLRVKPVVDVETDEIESEMSEMEGMCPGCGSCPCECAHMHGEPHGDFEGAAPNDMPEEEPAKEMTPQKKQNKVNHVPNQDAAGLLMAIKGELMKESSPEYKRYFDSMLKKFGVSSPAQLSKEQKRKFFNAVDKGWKGARENKSIEERIRLRLREIAIGSQAARMLKKKTMAIMRRNPGMSMKQAARMAQAR